ncbi:MAG TPA: response regulator [Chthoniobacterales bacterium]|nr:response regulator [Chthoniobacterales bacterium]
MSRPLRLLLVSDLETDLVLCRDLLDELGIRVSLARAESVASAIREISRTRWDTVLVSASIEDLLSNEFLPTLKATDADTPVIVLCDDFDEERFVRILQAGATDAVSRKNRERIKRVLSGFLSDSPGPASLSNEEHLIRQKEELLWLLFESSADPLALIRVDGDGDYSFALANRALVRVAEGWGFSPSIDQVIGRNTRELALNDWKLPWDLYWKLHSQISNACAFRKSMTHEQEWDFPAGIRSSMLTFYPIFNAEDPCNFVLVRLKEIVAETSEPTESESTARVQAQKMESLGALAGGIAHDFNNILTCILGYTEVAIRKAEVGHPAYEDLNQILAAGFQARELVNQILTFSRKQPAQKRKVDLNALVEDGLRLLRSGAPPNVSIETLLPSEELELFVDPNQLLQVILNLCTNAFHAMPEHSGKLTITAKPIPANSRHRLAREMQPGQAYVELIVTDTGLGMSAETMRRIFEPLFTTKSSTQGTGLGLSIVHGIVRSHGGFIHVESKLGKGSQFHVFLPKGLPATATEVATEVHSLPHSEPDKPPSSRAKHVLIVDDDRDVGRLAARILETFQYEVTALTDPTEAVNLVRKRPSKFDLVLTDLLMPELSGPELARALKKIRPDLPLVLISGLVSSVTEESARRQGFVGLIRKPFEIDQMAKSVAGILDNPSVVSTRAA